MTTHLTQRTASPPTVTIAADGHPRRRLILGIMCVCLGIIVAGVGSLNVAIPSIVSETGATSAQQLWIVGAYALVFAVSLLPAGVLGDRHGRKPTMLAGLGIFAAASLMAAFADAPSQLIALRAIMGIGAALILPAALATITVVHPTRERPQAIATWAGLAGIGGALGPLGAGLLLGNFWFGSVFLIAVPACILSALAIIMVVPDSANPDRHQLDLAGVILSVVGLGGIVGAIIQGPELGWLSPMTLGLFAIGAVSCVAFVRWELHVPHAILDPRLFLIPRFGLGSLTVTTSFVAVFGMLFLMTIYLQNVLNYSPIDTALALLPYPVILITLAPRSTSLTKIFGTRRIVRTGFALQATGFLVATQLQVDSPYWLVAAAVAPIAAGSALVLPPSTHAIVSSAPRDRLGVASAVHDTAREVGGAIGIALLGTLMTLGYHASIHRSTRTLSTDAADQAADSIGGAELVASRIGGESGAELVASARQAFLSGAHLAFAAVALLSATMVVVIHRHYPRDMADHREFDHTR